MDKRRSKACNVLLPSFLEILFGGSESPGVPSRLLVERQLLQGVPPGDRALLKPVLKKRSASCFQTDHFCAATPKASNLQTPQTQPETQTCPVCGDSGTMPHNSHAQQPRPNAHNTRMNEVLPANSAQTDSWPNPLRAHRCAQNPTAKLLLLPSGLVQF